MDTPTPDLPARDAEVSGCFGKVAYATAREAETALRRMTRRPSWRAKGRRRALMRYRCRHCAGFHLGNAGR